jgi:hypothetical protein
MDRNYRNDMMFVAEYTTRPTPDNFVDPVVDMVKVGVTKF